MKITKYEYSLKIAIMVRGFKPSYTPLRENVDAVIAALPKKYRHDLDVAYTGDEDTRQHCAIATSKNGEIATISFPRGGYWIVKYLPAKLCDKTEIQYFAVNN